MGHACCIGCCAFICNLSPRRTHASTATRSAEGYRRYVTKQIAPHINKPLQRLAPLDIEAWHTALRRAEVLRR